MRTRRGRRELFSERETAGISLMMIMGLLAGGFDIIFNDYMGVYIIFIIITTLIIVIVIGVIRYALIMRNL